MEIENIDSTNQQDTNPPKSVEFVHHRVGEVGGRAGIPTQETPPSRSDKKLFQKYEKLKAYSGKVITNENVIACIIFAMKLFKKSSMDGLTKKETVVKLIKTLIDEFSPDDLLKSNFNENFIGFVIESVYFEFKKNFKNKKLCF